MLLWLMLNVLARCKVLWLYRAHHQSSIAHWSEHPIKTWKTVGWIPTVDSHFFSSKHFFMYLITIFSFVTLEVVMRKTIIKFNEKGVCLTKLFTDVCLVVHLIFPVKNCLNTALKTQIPTQVIQRTSQHRRPKGHYNRNYLPKPTLWTMNFRLTYLDSLRNLINILRLNDGLNTNRKNQLIHITCTTILYKSNKYK